jgi:hypothetical protein
MNKSNRTTHKSTCTSLSSVHSEKPPAYLEPNRGSLQEPIGGMSENDRREVTIDAENNQTDVENWLL